MAQSPSIKKNVDDVTTLKKYGSKNFEDSSESGI